MCEDISDFGNLGWQGRFFHLKIFVLALVKSFNFLYCPEMFSFVVQFTVVLRCSNWKVQTRFYFNKSLLFNLSFRFLFKEVHSFSTEFPSNYNNSNKTSKKKWLLFFINKSYFFVKNKLNFYFSWFFSFIVFFLNI